METSFPGDKLFQLLETISDLNSSSDRRGLSIIVAEGIRRILDLGSSFFYVLDETGEDLVLEAYTGEQENRERFPAGYGFVGWVGKSGQVMAVEDRDIKGLIEHFIAAPVRGKTRILGVVGGRRRDSGAFTNSDKELAAIFGSQVGIHVENYIFYQRMRRSKEFRDKILFSIPSGVIVVNPGGTIKTFNNSALLCLGEEGSLKGRAIGQVFGSGQVAESIGTVRESGKVISHLDIAYRGRTLNVDVVPLGSGEEGPRDVMIVMNDITEFRKAYDEKERSNRLSSLGQLAAGVAHELRNPLTGINILLEMVKEDPGISAASLSHIDKVLAENTRLEEMVTSLLEVSKPLDLKMETISLNSLVEDFVNDHAIIAEKKGVELRKALAGDDIAVNIDVKRFRQVLVNLFNNSLECTGPGDRITISGGASGQRAVIAIRDTGCGIVPENAGRVFEPFFTTRAGGTGLGLYIAQGIVRQQGGEIQVNSDGTSYTEFRIELPKTGGA